MPLKLFVFDKPPSVPSSSYYCQKLETYLCATSTPYTVEFALPFSALKGKLFFVEFEDGEKLLYRIRSSSSAGLLRLTRPRI